MYTPSRVYPSASRAGARAGDERLAAEHRLGGQVGRPGRHGERARRRVDDEGGEAHQPGGACRCSSNCRRWRSRSVSLVEDHLLPQDGLLPEILLADDLLADVDRGRRAAGHVGTVVLGGLVLQAGIGTVGPVEGGRPQQVPAAVLVLHQPLRRRATPSPGSRPSPAAIRPADCTVSSSRRSVPPSSHRTSTVPVNDTRWAAARRPLERVLDLDRRGRLPAGPPRRRCTATAEARSPATRPAVRPRTGTVRPVTGCPSPIGRPCPSGARHRLPVTGCPSPVDRDGDARRRQVGEGVAVDRRRRGVGLDQGGHRGAHRLAGGRGPRSRPRPPPPRPRRGRPWPPGGGRAGRAGACARRGRTAARPAGGPGSTGGPSAPSPSRGGRPGSATRWAWTSASSSGDSSPSRRALRSPPGCSPAAAAGGGHARTSRSMARPRWMRLRTVPTGTSRATAISW